jgi:FtsP/CotA-like multicopper oxidase with cupredoxin domain
MSKYVLVLLLCPTFALVGCPSGEPTESEPPITIILEEPEPEEEPWEPPTIQGWEVAEDLNPSANTLEVRLRAQLTEVEVAPGRTLPMMTYNGSFPGPLIQAKVGDRVIVHFENGLDEPTTVHWHGLRIPDAMDGSPRIQDPVEPGETFTYDFVVPDAGTFWYHPHVRTNEQLEKGLYGPLVVHDPADPVVGAERLVILDDALLDGDDFAPFMAHHMELVHGRTGNALMINGQLEWPVEATATARTERWRLINTSNARTFVVVMNDASLARVVATDGGRLAEPHDTRFVEVAVGQRYDLLVEHTAGTPQTLIAYIPTVNDANELVQTPFPLYRVTPSGLGPASEPADWSTVPHETSTSDREIELVFDGYNDEVSGRLVWTLNGQADAREPLFSFAKDEVVTMRLVNRQNPEHPFHLHGQFFEILDDGSGQAVPGLKDTVLVPGQATVTIRAYMSNAGKWMAHCHILEHAELGMMSEIEVQP